MISCTEFIPLYSEFFKYLEGKGGPDAVMNYWYHISDNSLGDKTNPNSLISLIERAENPFEGAVNYWNHTLTEEACDLYKVIDADNHLCYSHMRRCPSRGMHNDLKHIKPYHNYCKHCDIIYQRVLDKYGIVHEMDFSQIKNAECTSLITDEHGRLRYGSCHRHKLISEGLPQSLHIRPIRKDPETGGAAAAHHGMCRPG